MTMTTTTIQGTVHGDTIKLDDVLDLPEGSRVTVSVQTPELSLEERRRVVAELAGSCADDPSFATAVDEIVRQRHNPPPREVDFDAAS